MKKKETTTVGETKMKEMTLTRRAAVGQLALGAGLAMAVAGDATTSQAQPAARTFVLVHGAYEGGWIWRYVAERLLAKGHKVFTPTLTGLGERSHLMSGLITLDTHVADVANVIKWESLTDIVLVGHSYAGWVISGVVERMPSQIASIIYLDAFMPEDGQRGLDLNSPNSRKAVLAAIDRAEVSRAPDYSGDSPTMMTQSDRAWLISKATSQPIGVSLQTIRLTGARDKVARKTYVRTRNPSASFDAAYAKVKSDKSWHVYDLPCGHWAMIEMPDRTTEILLENA
jgi:pimeloyl-ACP methyl ester carboxylesterase